MSNGVLVRIEPLGLPHVFVGNGQWLVKSVTRSQYFIILFGTRMYVFMKQAWPVAKNRTQ